MNKRVSFPIAKLLKEKGFDGYKDKYHYPNLSDKQEICLPTDWNKFTDMAGNSEYYSAPTIADVVMWIYEKHGIWIWVGCRDLENGKTIFIANGRNVPSTKSNGFVIDVIPYQPKDNPTEAYETAFEHILNKLI
jgi:hypothetical protein